MAGGSAFNFNLTLKGTGQYAGMTGSIVQPSESLNVGNGPWPKCATNLALGNNQTPIPANNDGCANVAYQISEIIPGHTTFLFDMANGTLQDDYNLPIKLTALKQAILSLDAPDGNARLHYGPQGVHNAFAGPLGIGSHGTAVANDFVEVKFWDVCVNEPVKGYPVGTTVGEEVFVISNPDANPVAFHLMLLGVE